MAVGTSEKRTIISFGRGLFVLRYAGSDDPRLPPRVYFAASTGTTAKIVSAPGLPRGELAAVGDLAVIAAEAPGSLDVLVRELRPGSGVACSVALDRLGPQKEAATIEPAVHSSGLGATQSFGLATQAHSAGAPTGDRGSAPARMLVHLSNLGDIAIDLGVWVGGPQAPTPIEGLALPTGLVAPGDLNYQVLTVGSNEWGPWVPAGGFAGSRGSARPLRGIRLRLSASHDLSLRTEALFLGAPVEQKKGSQLEFMSSSPFDAMVGLRIELVRDAAHNFVPSSSAAVPAATSRLKVFRSSRA